MSARILIVDDHEVLREGLKSLIANSRPDWEICGEATDGGDGVRSAQELNPDLMLLDITMPRVNGFEALAQIRKLGMRTPVLMFTTHHYTGLASEVRQAGAQGYVVKSEAARKLLAAISTLLAGGTFFDAPQQPASPEDKPEPGFILCRALPFAT